MADEHGKTERSGSPQLDMFPLFDMEEVMNSEKRAREAAAKTQKQEEPPAEDSQLAELKAGPEHYGKLYTGIDFAQLAVHGNEFENCTFTDCHFVKAHLEGTAFRDCTFQRCDLVLAKLDNATIDNTCFNSCKLMGLEFGGCNRFSFTPSFKDSLMTSCVYEANILRNAVFFHCTVRECEFLACDLTATNFDATTLENTHFDGCTFKDADFTSAHGYSINPFENRMKGGRFSLPEAQSFLYYMEISIE